MLRNSQENTAVIKILKKDEHKARCRFKDEYLVMIKNQDIEGVMPIIDSSFSKKSAKLGFWYVMPFAEPLTKHLKDKNAEEIVDAVLSISETLHKLHKGQITHRDIKPPNLFYLNGKYCIGDFGLVGYPEKEDLTVKGGKLGPKWTMAPEMRRNPESADGKPADVYSLAKTLWILLTNERKGFEGKYIPDDSIRLKKYQKTIYAIPLDKLLGNCTENDPSKRPAIKEFIELLNEWKELNRDYVKRNKSQWIEVQRKLFPTALPKRVIWEDKDQIIKILKEVSSFDHLNHMLFPYSGGLDLDDVGASFEENCIELILDGTPYIVRPKRLIFESFGDDPEWNYFRFESEGLYPVCSSKTNVNDEVFTEIEPGVYTDYECKEFDDFDGKRLPSSARYIKRILNGDFVN